MQSKRCNQTSLRLKAVTASSPEQLSQLEAAEHCKDFLVAVILFLFQPHAIKQECPSPTLPRTEHLVHWEICHLGNDMSGDGKYESFQRQRHHARQRFHDLWTMRSASPHFLSPKHGRTNHGRSAVTQYSSARRDPQTSLLLIAVQELLCKGTWACHFSTTTQPASDQEAPDSHTGWAVGLIL